MTTDQFCNFMARRHENMKPSVLGDIRVLMEPLTDAVRDDMAQHYRDNWEAGFAPKAAWFKKQLKTSGGDKSGVMYGARICGNCDARYPIGSYRCPKCGGMQEAGIDSMAHPKFVPAQDDCWQCKLYEDDFRRYGPSCEQYGKGTQSLEMCRDCKCRPCCSFAYSHKVNKDFATGKTVKKHMPWIKE